MENSSKIKSAQLDTIKVVSEVKIAIRSWALLTALKGYPVKSRHKLIDIIHNNKLHSCMSQIHFAFLECCLMAIFRVTGQATKESSTFLNIADKLSDADYLTRFIFFNKKFYLHQEKSDSIYEEKCRNYAQHILSTIPMNWKNSGSLSNDTIKLFRERYKGYRDNVLAHSAYSEEAIGPMVSEIEQVISEIAKLANYATFIHFGYSEDLEKYSEEITYDAFALWDLFEDATYEKELSVNPGFASDKDQIR